MGLFDFLFNKEKPMDFLPGLKSYIGVAVTFVGMLATQFGWSWWEAVSAQVEPTVNAGIAFAGAAFTLYGLVMKELRKS